MGATSRQAKCDNSPADRDISPGRDHMNYESSAVLKQCATTSLSSQCTVPQLFDSVKAEPEEAASSDFQQSVSAESDCFSTTTTTTTDLLEIKPERQLLEIKPERQSPQQAWAPPNFHHYPKPSPAYNAQLPFGVSPVECSYGYQPEMSSPNYEGDYHPNIYSYPVRQAQPPQPAAAVVFTEPISVHSNSSSAFSDTNSPHESPTESTFPPAKAVMICKVCGDKASGYHYGVTSCEGCKGFFRRSIQKATMYKCLRGGDCQVQRMNRNRCQACRMRKCQEVGMSKNSVRTSRSNRRSTIREDSSDSDRAEVSSTTSPEPLEYNDNPFLIAIFKAHDANTPFRDAVSYDRQQLRILNILPETPNEDERRCVGWKLLAEALVPDIRSVIEFVKLIPDFAYLSGNDQCSLLKMQFFGVFLVRYASGFTSEGLQLSEDRLVDMRTLQVVYGMGLTREMLMFADKLNDLKPTGLTIALLSALFLASPKRGVFESTDMIINLRMRIMDAFDNHLRKQFASSLHARALFMELIEDLQNRTALHDREHDFLRYHPSPMSMPPLYAEIYRAEPCPINYNTQIE